MKHVDGILGIITEDDTKHADVSLHISGTPDHVKHALRKLVHPKGKFGKNFPGQAAQSVGGKVEPSIPDEKELGISHPKSVAHAGEDKGSVSAADEKETHSERHAATRAPHASGKAHPTKSEKEVGIGSPHKVEYAESISQEAVDLVNQLLEVED